MLETALFTIAIAAGALLAQHKIGIPTPITIILSILTLSIAQTATGHQPGRISDMDFDALTYLMLPILICSDALALRWSDIKHNAVSLTYVAGVMIILSVGVGIALERFILPDYHLGTAAMAALMCMVLATDPITVTSVFGRFKLSHALKAKAEGEGLLNDASALIVFSIALSYMGVESSHAGSDPFAYSIKVIGGALIIGLIIGWLGLQTLRFVHDAMTETMIILMMALGSFAMAEHMHSSGILAVIVSIMFANSVMTQRLHDPSSDLKAPSSFNGGRGLKTVLAGAHQMIKDAAAYRVVQANIQFAAIIAATILFITMASLIDLKLLMRYSDEIIYVFVATTIIRMLMLGIYAKITHLTNKVVTIPLHWWKVLAAAGVKGSFSLLMLHMIPKDFIYLELFEAIVVGNILLSTFLYPIALVVIFKIHEERFTAEYEADHLAEEE